MVDTLKPTQLFGKAQSHKSVHFSVIIRMDKVPSNTPNSSIVNLSRILLETV